MSHLITRSEYMQNSKELHVEYYFQFATPVFISIVRNVIGEERIKSSKNEYFNDIALHIWDKLQIVYNRKQMELAGDYLTLSVKVCIAKAIAAKIRIGQL